VIHAIGVLCSRIEVKVVAATATIREIFVLLAEGCNEFATNDFLHGAIAKAAAGKAA
jgi:hypothetical protein